MTDLQKLILDTLDQTGSMTWEELARACKVKPQRRGGFVGSLNSLIDRELVFHDAYKIWISANGVHAIEATNIAAERRADQ